MHGGTNGRLKTQRKGRPDRKTYGIRNEQIKRKMERVRTNEVEKRRKKRRKGEKKRIKGKKKG